MWDTLALFTSIIAWLFGVRSTQVYHKNWRASSPSFWSILPAGSNVYSAIPNAGPNYTSDMRVGDAGDGKGNSSSNPVGSPTTTQVNDGVELSVFRPLGYAVSDAPPAVGVFATPVALDPKDIFMLTATIIAPSGPVNQGCGWTIALQFRPGDLLEIKEPNRGTAALKTRFLLASKDPSAVLEAQLNAMGQLVSGGGGGVPFVQKDYDTLFVDQPAVPFTLRMVVDRVAGQGTVAIEANGSAIDSYVVTYDPAVMTANATGMNVFGVAVISGSGCDATVAKATIQEFNVYLFPQPRSAFANSGLFKKVRWHLINRTPVHRSATPPSVIRSNA
jgi:hypothetical protein